MTAYRLPFKTRLLLAAMRLFRSDSPQPPTPRQLAQARREFPRVWPFTWALGRPVRNVIRTDRTIPVRDAEIPVRIYSLGTAQAVRPLIVNYHGGGWAVGNLQNNDYYCSRLAAEVGAVVVSVAYRLAPEHKFPTGVQDAYDALCWAVAHAHELGADPSRVAVTGDSAGGNLAAACSLMARDLGGPRISLQALIYPGTDSRLQYPSLNIHAHAPILTKTDIIHFLAMYARTKADLAHPYLSPILAPSLAGLPPAVVVTAGYDPLCDDGQGYARRLDAEGTPTTLLHYPEDIHGFCSLPNHTLSGKAAIAALVQHFRAALDSDA